METATNVGTAGLPVVDSTGMVIPDEQIKLESPALKRIMLGLQEVEVKITDKDKQEIRDKGGRKLEVGDVVGIRVQITSFNVDGTVNVALHPRPGVGFNINTSLYDKNGKLRVDGTNNLVASEDGTTFTDQNGNILPAELPRDKDGKLLPRALKQDKDRKLVAGADANRVDKSKLDKDSTLSKMSFPQDKETGATNLPGKPVDKAAINKNKESKDAEGATLHIQDMAEDFEFTMRPDKLDKAM